MLKINKKHYNNVYRYSSVFTSDVEKDEAIGS